MQEEVTVKSNATKRLALSQASHLAQIVLGSIFLGIMAQIAIPLPFTPVPMTLQTLAVAMLAITLGPKKAPLAVAAYLLQATAGLPVIAGGISNPLWIFGPRAGYLIGFLASACIVSALLDKLHKRTFIKTWLVLSLNEAIVLSIGGLWLSFFLGWQSAITMGILSFLPGAAIKITVAATAVKPIDWLKSKM